jgi:hypothetical protein
LEEVVVGMTNIIKATNPEDLASVTDLIHDCWFDTRDIAFDAKSHTVTMRFKRQIPEAAQKVKILGPFRKRVTPVAASILRIAGVQKWTMIDTERVGRYDFNELKPERQILEITTGIPLVMRDQVDEIQVSLETSAELEWPA